MRVMILKKKVKLSLLMSLLPNVGKVASSVSEEIKNINARKKGEWKEPLTLSAWAK